MQRLLFFLLAITTLQCSTTQGLMPPTPSDYEAQLEQWRNQRMASLTSPTGWLSLVGLHWLQEGETTFGSAPENQLVLPPDVPAVIGSYLKRGDQVSAQVNSRSEVKVSDDGVSEMSYGAIQWFLIERGGNYGIRIRDTLLPTRIRLRPIEYFATDAAYRVYAQFTPAENDQSVMMRNVLDMEYAVPIEGSLQFKLLDKTYNILALDGGPDDLFLIISDESTGESTYGGGRYLYCPRPDRNGRTIIDFNKAHNPPCAFTEFATCLLPLDENHIGTSLLVGEMDYGNH